MSCVFYGENTLDKSLFRKSIWKTTPAKVVSTTSSILQMMDTVEQTSTAPAFSQ